MFHAGTNTTLTAIRQQFWILLPGSASNHYYATAHAGDIVGSLIAFLTIQLYQKSKRVIQFPLPLQRLTLLGHFMFAMTTQKQRSTYACLPVPQAKRFTLRSWLTWQWRPLFWHLEDLQVADLCQRLLCQTMHPPIWQRQMNYNSSFNQNILQKCWEDEVFCGVLYQSVHLGMVGGESVSSF